MSTWYRSGTASFTNGSATVTGSGTAFIANAQIGEALLAPDGRVYEITNIPSDTSLTISPAYLGSTASGQGYAIAPLRGRIAQLLSETSSLIASFAAVRDGIGAGLMADGTASLPGLRFAADQDTGLRRFDTNAMSLVTGGSDRVILTAAGNVGLAVAPGSQTRLQVNGRVLATGGNPDPFDGTPSGVSISYDTAANVGHVVAIQTGVSARELRLSGNPLTFFVGGSKFLEVDPAGVVKPGSDNAQAFGTASLRWATIFAGNGTINTSDEREKVWRGPSESAAVRAANRIIGELGFFQWHDAVAEKGEDGARIHFGVRAQEVMRIMMEEGLEDEQPLEFEPGTFIDEDARPSFRHGFLCFDTWETETEAEVIDIEVPAEEPSGMFDASGSPVMKAVMHRERSATGKMIITRPAGNRFGLRIDQLTMFLLAGLASRVAALEAAK